MTLVPPTPHLSPTLVRQTANRQTSKKGRTPFLGYPALDQFDQFWETVERSQFVCSSKKKLVNRAALKFTNCWNLVPILPCSSRKKKESRREDRKRQELCIRTGGRTTTDCGSHTSIPRRLCAHPFHFWPSHASGRRSFPLFPALSRAFLRLTISNLITLNSNNYDSIFETYYPLDECQMNPQYLIFNEPTIVDWLSIQNTGLLIVFYRNVMYWLNPV